jgi:hypothetical protein
MDAHQVLSLIPARLRAANPQPGSQWRAPEPGDSPLLVNLAKVAAGVLRFKEPGLAMGR